MVERVEPMYRLKPVLDPNTVFHYNSSMYAMKNLIECSLSSQTGSGDCSDDVYNHIEKSQQVIFDYIKAIKKQIQELRQILLKRSSNSETTKKSGDEMSSGTNLSKTKGSLELVINADINNPPYSLLVLHHLTNQILSLKVTSHFHSSLSGEPDTICRQFDKLNNGKHKGRLLLNIRLIWKEGGGTTVVPGNVPLCGEVSLLRFVHSYLDHKLNPAEQTKLQEILDDINNTGTKSFEAVKGSQYLVADRLTVADLALWSALKHSSNDKLQHWFQHFNKLLSV